MTLSDNAALTEALSLFPHSPPWVGTLAGLAALICASAAANFVVKHVILRLMGRLIPTAQPAPAAISARLANIVPAMIVSSGIALVPHLPEWVVTVTRNIIGAFIVLTIALAISRALSFVNELYSHR
ncbi:MAG TPA: mechanosensitive ion channel family protein, partial [Devosia sp.]|nr:mechanosensitive ion channel family protein [Devosia sp.]